MREQAIGEEIYRVTKALLKKPRDKLLIPEESCLSAIEEYCRNELSPEATSTIFKKYYVHHPVTVNPLGCLTSIGLLGGSVYGFTRSIWLGLGGIALTIATGITNLRKAGRYEMARDQIPDVWRRAVEQAKPKLEELLRNYK